MKRVAFAWVTMYLDFSTKEEAIEYVKKNSDRGWRFIVPSITTYSGYSASINAESIVYRNGNGNELPFTVQIEKSYRDYNMG